MYYQGNHDMVLCTYPLFNIIVFGTFGIMHVPYFLCVLEDDINGYQQEDAL